MNGWINPLILAPLLFVPVWLAVTTLFAWGAGWFRLVARFPDRAEEPLLQVPGQSGWLAEGAYLRGLLVLSACPSGLRIGMSRLFAPFCRSFFVPWQALSVTRKDFLFSSAAELRFGTPSIGSLTIPTQLADRLAYAAGERWPETGPFAVELSRNASWSLLTQWAVATFVVALFFALVPRFAGPAEARPLPVLIAVLFPGIVFGAIILVRYFRERS